MFIRTKNLSYTYLAGTPLMVRALRGIDLAIARGSFTVLLGASGSGKSTLLQHFNGLLRPTEGSILIEGEPLKYGRRELRELRRRIGLVFQEPESQFFSETLFDEIAFAPRNFGLTPSLVQERVSQALRQVGLDDPALVNRSPFHLSAGQQRLAAIAAVLAMQPQALILDEPGSGLDQVGQQRLFSLLQQLNRAGVTVVVVTHRLEQIVPLADHFLVLHRGRLVLQGPPEGIFSRVEELHRCGLSVPPVMKLVEVLRKAGLPLSPALHSLEELRREIGAWWKGGDAP
ncbi:MAG: energy-coupling factor transporter ATPase [Firmicutes bacterium]|jgi:energy-coupling factor transport system ATP-binding protein|nr:energy-coupling factor transporter ATPase [Bacillota bacterium]